MLLRKEAKGAEEASQIYDTLRQTEESLEAGIGTNVEYLGGEIEIDDDYWDEFSSFLASKEVGVATLAILHMLSKPKDQIDWIHINYLLGSKVLQAVSRNLSEHELMTGQTGYLYALLLIEKKLRQVGDKKRLNLH